MPAMLCQNNRKQSNFDHISDVLSEPMSSYWSCVT
eukprot:CAMPEP_0197515300 /NCGR_PEP_ID=MMETSP1318-20131121/475_1 /TAXON_ID=552666 /ORGANISM="Partenskyella glossopodia, Strain RCC365" /LENGTH=34 /DNA_ID= /DNA_START= /DNA_END= /DNA_ORIENTATION=